MIDEATELHLVVNGLRYGGWKSIRVTRSIESISGSFDLDASDRWGEFSEPWPIAEEDRCRVEIADTASGTVTPVIDGYVDRRRLAGSAGSLSLGYQGRDLAAALVDNSVLDKFSFASANVVDVAKKLAAPFGITVTVQPGFAAKNLGHLAVNPGDSPFQALQRAAVDAGVLLVSDGRGGLLITRAGTERLSTALVQGENVLDWDVEFDATQRFFRYIVKTGPPGTDWFSGAQLRVTAEAKDLGVRRSDRVHLIHPEHGLTSALAQVRADWEARVRAARAEKVSVTVPGWTVDGKRPWPLNVKIPVKIPRAGVDGDLLISEAEHVEGPSGKTTKLGLVRPDAFLPEPHAIVRGTGQWKELAGGAK